MSPSQVMAGDVLTGSMKGKNKCDGDKKHSGFIKNANVEFTEDVPNIEAIISIQGGFTFNMVGVALYKNHKQVNGDFLITGDDNSDSTLIINGKFNAKNGSIFKAGGKFNILDTDGDCLITGKFQAN